MTEFNEYAPGTFCWVDLGTTDTEAAKRFYGSLFGWEADDMPAGPDMVYTMLRLRGKDVAALYGMEREQRDQGIPPHWLSYVSVASADATAAKASDLGGKALMGPGDVLEAGRMALLQDSAGATFGVWQPRDHFGARIVNEPGTLCWNELATRDDGAARVFYTGLFGWTTKGWTTETQNAGPVPYTTFLNGGRPNGGMLQMAEEWGNVRPHWVPYFAVEDCDRTVDRVGKLGGSVRVPATDIPETGRFAMLQDPQGAVFSVIKLDRAD